MEAALKGVKNRVDPGHFQIFELAMVQEWPTKRIAKALGVSAAYVYPVKHRVRLLVKAELKRLGVIP
jgi:DNA-directed RNA polymerase specialized sigma24 family protein